LTVGNAILLIKRDQRVGADKETAMRSFTSQDEDALAARLREHVAALAGRIGPRTMKMPAAWARATRQVQRELEKAGGSVEREKYAAGEKDAVNYIVERRGWAQPERVLVIGAHYDTVPGSPGADDNASAVAALIEMVRQLADLRPRKTVRFVAFANEEHPHGDQGTMGSQAHAAGCRQRGERAAVLALEMLGYYEPGAVQRYPKPLHLGRGLLLPRRADFLAMVSNFRSARLLWQARGAFRLGSDFPLAARPLPEHLRLIRRSDHAPFWDVGYPGVMVTDTSFLRNPHYHMSTDRPGTLDYARLARVTAGLQEMARYMVL